MAKKGLSDIEIKEKVEAYLEKIENEKFRSICEAARKICLKAGTIEEVKWGIPSYSHRGLVVGVSSFKNHVGIWFYQGSLLYDPENILIQAQYKTKGLRSIHYKSMKDFDPKVLLAYVKEAMLLNEKGIKVDLKKDRTLDVPDYFLKRLKKNKKAYETFQNFSYSHKKEYVEWVVEAKREETRERRIEKSIEMMSEGKGRHDKYRNS
ncbi:MAG: hypothetical protein HKN39_05165 [Flavobacteriales bacterium]|nr:hypothetical protein [Flavobacteriales bacterium]